MALYGGSKTSGGVNQESDAALYRKLAFKNARKNQPSHRRVVRSDESESDNALFGGHGPKGSRTEQESDIALYGGASFIQVASTNRHRQDPESDSTLYGIGGNQDA